MEAYTSFAQVYDLFMDNVPYEEWSEYIIALLKEEKIEDGLVLDLGCGTGKLTRLLAAAGYDMIGIDYSEDMLEIAREHLCHNSSVEAEQVWDVDEKGELSQEVLIQEEDLVESDKMQQDEKNAAGILYLLQDMREFELYGTVRAIISICDSMNYILEEEDLLQVFKLVNNYLDPKGIFIFDMNTRYKYADLLGETTITENREEGSFIWDNYFDEEEDINQYDLTLFIREEGDLYRKYEETHYQRVYDLDTIKSLLKEAGMQFVAAYDAFTKNPVREDSERIYIIAREHGK